MGFLGLLALQGFAFTPLGPLSSLCRAVFPNGSPSLPDLTSPSPVSPSQSPDLRTLALFLYLRPPPSLPTFPSATLRDNCWRFLTVLPPALLSILCQALPTQMNFLIMSLNCSKVVPKIKEKQAQERIKGVKKKKGSYQMKAKLLSLGFVHHFNFQPYILNSAIVPHT